MVRPMVHSQKHLRQHSLFTLTAGAATVLTIINAVNVVDKNSSSEVEEGSTVKAVYFEMWMSTNDTASGSVIATVEKLPAGADDPNTTTLALLNDYPNKKNILHTFQGLNNPKAGVVIPMLKQWIKIPKGKQRFGLGDKLILSIFSQTGTYQACGLEIYKEYT